MPFSQVRDLKMYYETAGSGPRLLFFNGSGGDLRYHPNMFDSPLGANFEMLAFDQRGLGQTDRPDIPYSMRDYADDGAALLDVVGWERCLVMGVSFGGMVAQEFALRYPNRVERLVLACSSSGGRGGASFPLHTLGDLSAEEKARHSVLQADSRRDEAWQSANAEPLERLVGETFARREVGAGEPGREMGAVRQLEARARHDTYDRLSSLSMPVYVCGGRYDGIAPVKNQEAIAAQIAGSQLALFEGGHQFLVQDPSAYAQVVEFLLAPVGAASVGG